MPRLRASDLAAMFEVYMLAVALGALKTALDTKSPWYLETETLWAYGTTFIGGIALLGVLLAAGVRLLPPRALPRATEPSAATSEGDAKPSEPGAGEDVDELLKSLESIAGSGDKEARRAWTRMVRGRGDGVAADSPDARRVMSRRILRTLLGPALAATILSGVSAALLPGAGGMLQSYFTVNTFLILTFAYGWGGLIAYALGSLYVAASQA